MWISKKEFDALEKWRQQRMRDFFKYTQMEKSEFWQNIKDQKQKELQRRQKLFCAEDGKCPVDGRMDRPIYITYNNKRTLAVADGMGHAYRVYGEGYSAYNSKCKAKNRYSPEEYEFDKGLSGFDF